MLLAGVGAGIASAYLVINTYSPLPHWDEWALFDHLAKGGGWSVPWLWEQHNEHRILTTKIFFLLDVELFHGTQVFLLTCIFLVQVLQVSLLSWSVRSFAGWRGSLWRAGTGLIAYCILCPTQYENLVWGFQMQFVLSACMATLSVIGLLLYRRDAGVKFLVVCIVAASLATWSLANGMLLWPLLVAAALWLRMKPRVWGSLLVAGALNIGLYFFHYDRPAGDTGLPPIVRSLHYIFVYFGSTFVRHSEGAIATIVGIVGIFIAAVVIVGVFRHRDHSSSLVIELSLLMLFTLATAAVTSTGRLHLGIEQATASRYQTFALLFWCCLGLALLFHLSGQRKAFDSLVAVLLMAQVGFATQVRLPIIDAQWRQLRLEKISLALLAGVHDHAVLAEAFPDPQVALRAADYMRRHQLSIFAGRESHLIGQPFEAAYHEAPASDCFGAVTSSQALPADSGEGLRLKGYAWDRSVRQPAKDILAVTDGKISGFGIVTVYPLFLRREHDPATAPRFEWIAYAAAGPAETTKLYVLLAHDKGAACPFAVVTR